MNSFVLCLVFSFVTVRSTQSECALTRFRLSSVVAPPPTRPAAVSFSSRFAVVTPSTHSTVATHVRLPVARSTRLTVPSSARFVLVNPSFIVLAQQLRKQDHPDLHQSPPPTSPPISLPSVSIAGFNASCFFYEICYCGLRTDTTQIRLTGGNMLFVVHVSSPSSTAMAPVCFGERNAPSGDVSSSSRGGFTFHSDSGHTLTGSSFVKDRIFKQLRLQPDHPKALYLLSDAYSHTLNQNKCVDSLLKFLSVTRSWPRHGNVKVRASDPNKPHASSPNSIVLRGLLEMKVEFEIHLVSWISVVVSRVDGVRFNTKSRQLRPFVTVVAYASLSASPMYEIHLVSSVKSVVVTDVFVVERDSPASSLSMRGESFQVFKSISVLNSSKSLSLGYFNVVSDYLKLSRAVVSRIQVKITCVSLYFEQASPFNTSIPCLIVLLLLLFTVELTSGCNR